ncbi:unnamed protein product [Diamesa hyperborea]
MLKCYVIVLMLNLLIISGVSSIYVNSDLKNITKRQNLSPADWTEPYEDGLWGTLLEEWTLNKNKESAPLKTREGRIIQTVQAPHFYNQPQQHPYAFQKYIPTSESYLNRRIGEAAGELEQNMRRPGEIGNGKVISNLVGPSSQQHQQQQQQQPPTFQKIYPQRQNNFNSPREVSETDLYLLGAIEKLVYRVDYMEKRLKRTEQLVYYLMAGNNQKLQADPCPKSFTKIGENCYHFETNEKSDWKTASSKCKSLGSSLAEMDKLSKFQDVVAHVLNNADHRGHDFWIGGLNPGLLWIWSTSARPVNPNANLSSFGNKTESTNKLPEKVLNQPPNKNATETPYPGEISGTGPCLRLSYNPTLFNYGYIGHDCAAKQNFMCVILDKTLDNEISRIAKELNFDLK